MTIILKYHFTMITRNHYNNGDNIIYFKYFYKNILEKYI